MGSVRSFGTRNDVAWESVAMRGGHVDCLATSLEGPVMRRELQSSVGQLWCPCMRRIARRRGPGRMRKSTSGSILRSCSCKLHKCSSPLCSARCKRTYRQQWNAKASVTQVTTKTRRIRWTLGVQGENVRRSENIFTLYIRKTQSRRWS